MTIRQLKTAVVRITGLGSREIGTWGRIASLNGRRLHLSLDQHIEPGTSARIDGPDFLLLGEICFCKQENGEYTAYFDMEHAASDSELKGVQSMLAQPSRTE